MEIGGVQLADGNEARSRRAEPGHRFADEPLVAVEPRVARRHVVHDRVAENLAECLFRGHLHASRPMTTPSSHSASTFAVSVLSQVNVAPSDANELAALP